MGCPGTILLAASIANVGMGLLAPFAGCLIDARSIRVMTLSGTVLFALGYYLIFMATAIWQIIVLYATLLPLGALLAGPLRRR